MEEKTVSLSLDTIIRECSLGLLPPEKIRVGFENRNRANIHSTFAYQKFFDSFLDRVDCYSDGADMIGHIRPSYEFYLRKIMQALNVPFQGRIVDDEVLEKRLMAQIRHLQSVTSEQELSIEFPMLYRDLVNGRRYIRDLERRKNRGEITEDDYKKDEHYYYSCGLQRSLKNFVKAQGEVYSRFVTRRKEYQKKIQHTDFNRFLREQMDTNKLFMYVMHEYLVKAEGSKDKEVIQKYVSLVEQYIASSVKKDVSITTDSGMKVTYQNIVNRLANLNRILHDNSSQVEWELIPSGRDYTRVKKDADTIIRKEKITIDEYLRLCQKGERKRAFYEGTPYMAKVIGLKLYHGYIGYIYENGTVLLDKEYDPNHPATAEGDAIYQLNVHNFEMLSQCNKKMIKKYPGVKSWNHGKTWEDRLRKVIDREATSEEKEASKQLIKRLSNKNESC